MFMQGTFPHKLWKLVNQDEEMNGIEWCDEGNKIIIDKKLFQHKCLNQGEFKTQKFLSITKQMNVYGFAQQAHPYNENYLIYKHKNFRKGHPELLIKFARRASLQSKKKEEKHATTQSLGTKKTHFVDRVALARAHFKAVLEDNVSKVLQLPTGITPPESEDDLDDEVYLYSGFTSAPPRCDPRLVMWNGNCQPPRANLPVYPMPSVHLPPQINPQPPIPSDTQWDIQSSNSFAEVEYSYTQPSCSREFHGSSVSSESTLGVPTELHAYGLWNSAGVSGNIRTPCCKWEYFKQEKNTRPVLPVHQLELPLEVQELPVHQIELPLEMQKLPVHQLPLEVQELPVHQIGLPLEMTKLPVHQLPLEVQELPVHQIELPLEMPKLPVHQLPLEVQKLPVHKLELPLEVQELFLEEEFRAAYEELVSGIL